MMFYPSSFWRTEDWESSTPKPRDGYIEDEVLFVGDFDEINIHLLPRRRTVRVRGKDATPKQLLQHGLEVLPNKSAWLFVHPSAKREIEAFTPTVYEFESTGFERVRKGEFVSRTEQRAISKQVVTMSQAIVRWNFQLVFYEALEELASRLRKAGIYCDVQT